MRFSDNIDKNTKSNQLWRRKEDKDPSDPYLGQKPQSLSTPSDFSEYTITDFPGYETQQ